MTARTNDAGNRKPGRLLALDIGTKRVGAALSDELQVSVRRLPCIERRSWKKLLQTVNELIKTNEAIGLVIGLPLRLDGSEGEAAKTARETAGKFRLSLPIPVYLQNESLTSVEAASALKASGHTEQQIPNEIDSEAAAIILRDFIAGSPG